MTKFIDWISTLWFLPYLPVSIVMIAIVVTCGTDNPTEPAPGGEKDEEDRDERIFTRADRAFLSSDGDSLYYIFTEEFFGNPVNRVSPIPIYGLILYNDRNELLRIAFGGFYNKDNEKKEDIHPDEYLKAFVRVRYDDLDDRPLYYLNIYAFFADEAEVEQIIRSHFSRIVLGKIEIETSVTF